MEMTKSMIAGIRPRSLFASAAPVVLTLALLSASNGQRAVVRVEALCAVAIAVLVQMLANLNSIYSTFHRSFNPMQASTTNAKDNKIVINLLSHKLVRMYSWLFLVLIMAFIGIAQLSGGTTSLAATGFFAALAVLSFLYCRHTKPLPIVGAQELLFGWAFGPIAMGSTSYLLIGTVPFAVILYASAVMFFTMAFQVLQSTTDAPFARRLGIESSSLASALGFDRAFQCFILFITAAYGILAMNILLLGHLPNLVLLFTMGTVRDISDAFREEKLKDLPDRLATLGAQLSAGLVVSIYISSLI